MSLTSAWLTAVQTGVLVFLLPLYLTERGRVGPAAVGYLVGLGVLGRLVACRRQAGAPSPEPAR